MLSFIAGTFVGTVAGVFTMCLFQINRSEGKRKDE